MIKIFKFAIVISIFSAAIAAIVGPERILRWIFPPIEMSFDFETSLITGKPNNFLSCPVDYCLSKPHLVSPVFAVSSDILRRRWMNLMAAQPRIEPGAADKQSMQYEFIQRSALVRFPDSITVRFISLGNERATLAIYSRSNYGYSDFGVNEARIRAWLKALQRK